MGLFDGFGSKKIAKRTFSETIHEALASVDLNSNVLDDNKLECRFGLEGGGTMIISISLVGDLSGFSLISISIPLHEVQFPLENTYGTLLKANAQRMVGKFMIRPVGNAAVIELSHKILYDEFNQEDFLAAFGTLAMEGPKWLT